MRRFSLAILATLGGVFMLLHLVTGSISTMLFLDVFMSIMGAIKESFGTRKSWGEFNEEGFAVLREAQKQSASQREKPKSKLITQ